MKWNNDVYSTNKLVESVLNLNEGVAPWMEKAKAELEKELEVETEITNQSGNVFSLESQSGKGSNGESEWEIYKNEKDAYKDAVMMARELLEGGQEISELLKMPWTKNFLNISPTDIRLIANEDASSYLDDIREEDDGERLADEAGMGRQFEKIQSQLEDEEDDKKRKKLEQQKEKLLDKAYSKLEKQMVKDTTDRLKNDLPDWLSEMGYEDELPKFVNFDWDKAAEYVVDTDGIAHTLDSYDGEELELSNGVVAYGTN